MHVSSLLFQLFYTLQAYIIERDTCSYGTKKHPLQSCKSICTVDDEYCLTQLFHQVISSADKKQSGIFY